MERQHFRKQEGPNHIGFRMHWSKVQVLAPHTRGWPPFPIETKNTSRERLERLEAAGPTIVGHNVEGARHTVLGQLPTKRFMAK